MSLHRLFNVFVIGALALMAALTFRLAAAAAVIVDDANPVALLGTYRAAQDECFDVPLKDAAACRTRTQYYAQPAADPAPAATATVDVCFDVGLRDACDD